jgi:hypothetical protein
MPDHYRVHDVSHWALAGDEPLGSKRKRWLREPGQGGRRWLFKHRQRPGTGDDWAERIVAAIADDLGVPHAETELAAFEEKPGVLSLDLTEDRRRGELVLGNDLLFERDPTYPRTERRRAASKYSLDLVISVLSQEFIRSPVIAAIPPSMTSALDVFIGYLMLDALVANLDRHHENWGVLQRRDTEGRVVTEVSPTFDHASSLARGITDDERQQRLGTRDRNRTVDAYCQRASSLFVTASDITTRLTTFEAFSYAGSRRPHARDVWIERLRAISESRMKSRVEAIPVDRMSDIAKEFCTRMLECNRHSLLEAESA